MKSCSLLTGLVLLVGLLEIPVPTELVAKDNTTKIEFRDSGGYLSTVTLEVTDLADR